MMAAGPIERNFIPHSTTLARGRMSGNRLGAGLGVGLAAFGFGGKARGAFGECVILGTGVSRGGAKGGPRGKANFDMIYMIYMIFDGLAEALGLRWVRKAGDRSLARSREGAKGGQGEKADFDMIYMIYRIFDGLAEALGLRWVRKA